MFLKTRLQLTALYALIIMGISIFFSSALYRISTFEISRVESRIRLRELRRPDLSPPVTISEDLLLEARRNILRQLIFINLFILFGSSVLSYWLSGRTLSPISNAMDAQKRFISDASHELKTPISSIKTGPEVYLRSKNKNQNHANSLIADTLVDINHLANLTQQLLLLNTQKVLPKSILNSAVFFNNIVSKLEPLAQKKNQKINTSIQAKALKLNEQSLQQVITILLDNAIKFSPPNSTIQVNFSKKIIKVIDTGPGIAKSDLPHIFDRFYQTNSSRTGHEQKGFGLGLSIAKQLCDQNNWTISCSSRPDKGSTFSILL